MVTPVDPSADLTPELAAKLCEVEREIERHQKAAAAGSRWFWLGVIPRLGQISCLLGIVLSLVQFALLIYARQVATSDHRADELSIHFLQSLGSLAGLLLSLLICTWAARYCQAKSDGKL